MAIIEVDVNIDVEEHLDEVSNIDLISELENRTLKPSEFERLCSIKGKEKTTLQDEMKMEFFLENFRSKTLEELEQFFKS